MSTIPSLELLRQAASAIDLVAQAQYQLLVVRGRQVQEAERESVEFRRDALTAEKNTEELADKIEDISKHCAIGTHGSPPEQLQRIGSLLEVYETGLGEREQELVECQKELEHARFLLAEHDAIANQPREPVPAGELPFDANEAAGIFLRANRGRIIGQEGMDQAVLLAWFANLVMRGYDEHARKYGKLIELCINGQRYSNNPGGAYSPLAEASIVAEADKFVDPGAPPKGWVAP